MAHAVGIDVGTSNVKVALLADDGEVAATAARGLSTLRSADAVEQDAEALWQSICDAVRELAAGQPARARDVTTIGVCSQYSSTIAVDDGGRPLAPLLTYFDQRGTDACFDIMDRHPDAFERFVDHHGVPPIGSGLSLGHILFTEVHRPEIAEQTVAYLEVMDYVGARLTGTIAATQATMFTSQVCDNRSLGQTTYDGELLDMSGLDAARLPHLLEPGAPVGTVLDEVADDLGLPRGVTVAEPMNDSHAGALATGAHLRGRHGIMIGTTAVLLTDMDRKAADFDHEVLSMPSPVPGRYLVWAENGVAGKSLEHLLQHVFLAADALGDHSETDRFGRLDAAAGSSPPGSNGVLFLPWLAGSLSPAADSRMRGAFLNLSLDSQRCDLVRAMLEGTAHNLAWLLPIVESFADERAETIVFGGGAARSALWGQILADVLDRPVLALDDPDHAVSRAVALAALHGSAACAAGGDRFVRTGDEFDPRPETRALYCDRTARFISAFEALRPIYQDLNG